MNILIFTGGAFPSPKKTARYFNSVSFDTIICADSGLDAYSKYRKAFHFLGDPEYILGDFDSIKNKRLLKKYSDRITAFPEDKDFSDTELALNKAYEILKEKSKEKNLVVLCGGDGGRIDHLLSVYESFGNKDHAHVWFCLENAIYLIEENQQAEISALTLKDNVSVLRPFQNYGKGKIKSEGLQWEWPLFRKEGYASLSNRISAGYFDSGKPVKLECEEGKFLICLPHTASFTLTSISQ